MFYLICLVIFAINLLIAFKYKNIETDNLSLNEYIKSKFEVSDIQENEGISDDIIDFDKFNNI